MLRELREDEILDVGDLVIVQFSGGKVKAEPAQKEVWGDGTWTRSKVTKYLLDLNLNRKCLAIYRRVNDDELTQQEALKEIDAIQERLRNG